jgi:hypothetical protein
VPDVDSLDRHLAFCFYSLAIENRQSTFEISRGGIAQLVERQLCKLEVRGSNPLASIFIGRIALTNRQLTTNLTTRPQLCADVANERRT